MKLQQQCLAVPNSDSMKPAKTFIPDKYNNCMNLKKLKRVKYFTKAILELRVWDFSEEEVSSCANITAVAEKGGGPEKGTKFRVFAHLISVGSHPCDTRWKPLDPGFGISGIF